MSARRNKTNWFKIIFITVLIIAAGVICFLVWKAYFSDDSASDKKNDDSAVIDDTSGKEEEKKEEKKEDTEPEKKDEKEKIPQYDGDDPNEKNELTGAITYAGILNQNLVIRVNIDQYVASGKCTLVLRRDGVTIYSTEAPIVDSASTSTCEGFDISVKALEPGPTNIIIYINGDGKTGELTKEIEL